MCMECGLGGVLGWVGERVDMVLWLVGKLVLIVWCKVVCYFCLFFS